MEKGTSASKPDTAAAAAAAAAVVALEEAYGPGIFVSAVSDVFYTLQWMLSGCRERESRS